MGNGEEKKRYKGKVISNIAFGLMGTLVNRGRFPLIYNSDAEEIVGGFDFDSEKARVRESWGGYGTERQVNQQVAAEYMARFMREFARANGGLYNQEVLNVLLKLKEDFSQLKREHAQERDDKGQSVNPGAGKSHLGYHIITKLPEELETTFRQRNPEFSGLIERFIGNDDTYRAKKLNEHILGQARRIGNIFAYVSSKPNELEVLGDKLGVHHLVFAGWDLPEFQVQESYQKAEDLQRRFCNHSIRTMDIARTPQDLDGILRGLLL
jgi:hypothetical protein